MSASPFERFFQALRTYDHDQTVVDRGSDRQIRGGRGQGDHGLAAVARRTRYHPNRPANPRSGNRGCLALPGWFFPAVGAAERQKAIDDNLRAIDEAESLGAPLIVLVCGADPNQSLSESRKHIQDGIVTVPGSCHASRGKVGNRAASPDVRRRTIRRERYDHRQRHVRRDRLAAGRGWPLTFTTFGGIRVCSKRLPVAVRPTGFSPSTFATGDLRPRTCSTTAASWATAASTSARSALGRGRWLRWFQRSRNFLQPILGHGSR